jgi:fluoroquinolone transport system permease protein
MFVIPVAVVLLCRLGVPSLKNMFPEMEEYYWLIVASLTSVTASTPSYLMGFIMLDERDENVHTLLRILPLPKNFILKSRSVFIVFLGFIFSVFILIFNGLIHFKILVIITVSILFALIPLFLTFAITAFAKNKIEAATMYKGLNIVLFLPMIAFFVRGIWKYLFGIIPFFWTFNALCYADEPLIYLASFTVSVFTHAIFTIVLYKIYSKKII